MTKEQIVNHWKKGAQDSLEVAGLCLEAQKYEHALFHSHLAVEKALKAFYVAKHNESPPYTHELQDIAEQIPVSFTNEQLDSLREMSRLAVRARYADHQWSSEQASEHNAKYWIAEATKFLDILLRI